MASRKRCNVKEVIGILNESSDDGELQEEECHGNER